VDLDVLASDDGIGVGPALTVRALEPKSRVERDRVVEVAGRKDGGS